MRPSNFAQAAISELEWSGKVTHSYLFSDQCSRALDSRVWDLDSLENVYQTVMRRV